MDLGYLEKRDKNLIVIMVVDEKNGMMFHQRRQSQDQMLREKILAMVEGKRLWMNAYSYRQFGQADAKAISVAEDFLDSAKNGEYCFVENVSVKAYEKKIEKVIIFRWNRRYPGDQFLEIDLSGKFWKLEHTEEFPGSSHEKITMEVYKHE